MAKPGARIILGLVCKICAHRNYITEKNKMETKEKLALTKYCNVCRKHTEHKETQKLK